MQAAPAAPAPAPAAAVAPTGNGSQRPSKFMVAEGWWEDDEAIELARAAIGKWGDCIERKVGVLPDTWAIT